MSLLPLYWITHFILVHSTFPSMLLLSLTHAHIYYKTLYWDPHQSKSTQATIAFEGSKGYLGQAAAWCTQAATAVTGTESEQLGQHMKMDCLLYVTTTQLQIVWETLQWEHSIASHPQLSILLTGPGLRLGRPVEAFHCSPTCRLWSKKETSLYQRNNSLKHQVFEQHLIYALQ